MEATSQDFRGNVKLQASRPRIPIPHKSVSKQGRIRIAVWCARNEIEDVAFDITGRRSDS